MSWLEVTASWWPRATDRRQLRWRTGTLHLEAGFIRIAGIGRDGNEPSDPELAARIDSLPGVHRVWATDWEITPQAIAALDSRGARVISRSIEVTEAAAAKALWERALDAEPSVRATWTGESLQVVASRVARWRFEGFDYRTSESHPFWEERAGSGELGRFGRVLEVDREEARRIAEELAALDGFRAFHVTFS